MDANTVDLRDHAGKPLVEILKYLTLELRSALSSSDIVRLDLSDLTDPDIRIVQIVAAARRHAAESGVDFALVRPVDDRFTDLLARAGFAVGEDPFWFQGNVSQ